MADVQADQAEHHYNGNGDDSNTVKSEEPSPVPEDDAPPSEAYGKLLAQGLIESVAKKLDNIYKTGHLEHKELDERAIAALIDFQQDEDAALGVLDQFRDSCLQHVMNTSSFLCGLMKAYRSQQKGEKKGPDDATLKKIQDVIERTGYTLDVTTGQRKYGGPPPKWEGSQPGAGHEVFCGRLPKDIFEDELVPLFEKYGQIWDLRIMMDPCYGVNKGYCFVTFVDKAAAQAAVAELDNHEIRPDKKLRCNISIANTRLFVGNIPKGKTRDEILEEFSKHVEGVHDVIIYGCADDPKKKNRGFAFLDFDCHKSASNAKRKLLQKGNKVWHCDIIVDWADPQEEPDDSTMSKVKVLYVRNLTSDVTEEELMEKFSQHGKTERVKKMKDYAFVHFEEREHALAAMEALNGAEIGKLCIDVSLAKPQTENAQKKKEMRRKEQERMRMMGYGPMRGGYERGGRGRGGWGRGGGGGRGGGMGGGFDDFGYYYDYAWDGGYGYSEPYRSGYPDPYYQGYDDYDESGYAPYGYSGFGGPRGGGGRGGSPRGGPFKQGPRGGTPRGGGLPRGGRMMPAPRGRAGMPARSPGGSGPRGGGGPMGGNGRGGGGPPGRGAPMGGPLQSQVRGGGKRKLGSEMGSMNPGGANKRRNITDEQSWGAQPIAQQPLDQTGYGYDPTDASQWYTDSWN